MNEEIHTLAAQQFNRVSRAQLEALGMRNKGIRHRLESGLIVRVEPGVYAFPPVMNDDRGVWMGATLTAPRTFLNRLSAACAWGVLERRPPYETVVRHGTGGRKRCGGIVIYRSTTLEGETTEFDGIPITSMPRTLLDIACFMSERALARAVRESIRLKRTTMPELGDYLGRAHAREGSTRLARALARYRGLPIETAKSGAEIRALELLRDADRPMPRLNVHVAGEEADLSWHEVKLIIEIDGTPFHQDVGADARKEAAWRAAGWQVERIASDDVYERPDTLLTRAPNSSL
jgi:predicted transcriptional regulator of viral defense system